MPEILNTLQCPACNQHISGVIPERKVPRIRVKLLLNLKAELLANLEAKTGWGKNELADMITTVIDSNLEDA